jgi:hypothetical protein
MVVGLVVLLGCSTTREASRRRPPASSALPVPDPALEESAAREGEPEGETHAVNAFVGGSAEIGDRDGHTFGVDYEYRFAPRWGVGGFLEAVTGLDRTLATGAQLYWHAVADLVLVAGPGLERSHEEWGGLLRTGGFYEFSLGNGFVLSPALFYDFTEHDNFFLYGLNLGYVW